MKRVLLSLLFSSVLLLSYAIIASIVLILLSKSMDDLDRNVVYFVDIPLRLPKVAYFYFIPPTADDYSMKVGPGKAILAVFFFVANVFIYAVPIYGVMMWAGYGKKKVNESVSPPPPPMF